MNLLSVLQLSSHFSAWFPVILGQKVQGYLSMERKNKGKEDRERKTD